jgi:hypothetical protein
VVVRIVIGQRASLLWVTAVNMDTPASTPATSSPRRPGRCTCEDDTQYLNLSIVSEHSLPHILLATSPLAFTTQRRHGRNSGLGAAFGLPLMYAQIAATSTSHANSCSRQ